MSLESAIRIFTEQGFSDPQWVVDTIQRAESLDELRQIMIADKTDLGADQFVSLRMKGLFKGDPIYAERTMAEGKKVLSGYGVSEKVIDYYFKELPEALFEITMAMELGKEGLPPLGDKDEDFEKVKNFFNGAKQYLFERLRFYVI